MKKLILTESDKKQIISAKEKAIMESFAKTFNSIKRIDENEIDEVNPETNTFDNTEENEKHKLNEMGGPIPKADIRITYFGAPNNIDDDKINRCVSEVKQKVDEILKNVFNVPINFVKVSFNEESL
jgi:hypothetical protein